jgi:hypothetical protein
MTSARRGDPGGRIIASGSRTLRPRLRCGAIGATAHSAMATVRFTEEQARRRPPTLADHLKDEVATTRDLDVLRAAKAEMAALRHQLLAQAAAFFGIILTSRSSSKHLPSGTLMAVPTARRRRVAKLRRS